MPEFLAIYTCSNHDSYGCILKIKISSASVQKHKTCIFVNYIIAYIPRYNFLEIMCCYANS